ncbi:hypothetical protein PUN28_010157 [Cardiocondyla obscurior]|uniref:Uncharacterized protein n=1 Tax=Cardiocondyla obscurior TaxID=286306 RepID=A0AAW2FPH8_9HYME
MQRQRIAPVHNRSSARIDAGEERNWVKTAPSGTVSDYLAHVTRPRVSRSVYVFPASESAPRSMPVNYFSDARDGRQGIRLLATIIEHVSNNTRHKKKKKKKKKKEINITRGEISRFYRSPYESHCGVIKNAEILSSLLPEHSLVLTRVLSFCLLNDE